MHETFGWLRSEEHDIILYTMDFSDGFVSVLNITVVSLIRVKVINFPRAFLLSCNMCFIFLNTRNCSIRIL